VSREAFASRYGPWAVVAGASEGLGAAFADAIALRGVSLVLLARRKDALEAVGARLESAHGVRTLAVACDLKDASFAAALKEAAADKEVGLLVYNAAYSFLAPLLERPLEDALAVVDVNVVGPIRCIHALAPAMRARRHGGIVLMSSIAGFQGAPRLAAYAASKAFNTILGESLWGELRPEGVDVLVSCAGAIRTPGYGKALAKEAPGTLDARDVAETTLNALGHRPSVVPGAVNRIARFVLGRLLPRSSAVTLMDRSTRALG
jgi:short-subunit dehydrogenase